MFNNHYWHSQFVMYDNCGSDIHLHFVGELQSVVKVVELCWNLSPSTIEYYYYYYIYIYIYFNDPNNYLRTFILRSDLYIYSTAHKEYKRTEIIIIHKQSNDELNWWKQMVNFDFNTWSEEDLSDTRRGNCFQRFGAACTNDDHLR